ncbi:aldose epimerase family protein [Caballeronia glathei]|jgi:aldose 1-epimerase|uniref:Aldose epimerase n=1 Tax=Caballeronia glathei TaxID=60547 RepID=A0A069PZT1_9BURK|nr:aldose epimerase [Caballeronia glathei]KDR42981.1 aldose epimerase [Caballeronia glathei]CDY75357.1 aldose epimerase family protein [Caballeronia glathei]
MERETVDLGAAPVLRIGSGPQFIEVAPAAGGRITRFATMREDGIDDWLAPVTVSRWLSDAWPKGGCYPLVPFSNRVRDARFPGPDGARVELSTFPGAQHALHGFGQYAAWSVEEQGAERIVLHYAHAAGRHGWPWAFDATQTISVSGEGARLSMRVANRSAQPMPAGFGFHPYFGATEAELDAAVDWRHEGEIAIEPSGQAPARLHVRDPAGYTRYLGGWDGRATLRYADGRTLRLEASARLSHVVVHCPAGAGYLCVEPVSHVSDGFNLHAKGLPDTGVAVIAPGSEIEASLVLETGARPRGGDGAW